MRNEIKRHIYNKDTGKFDQVNTGLFYEKFGDEGVYDFYIYPNEDTEEYLAIVRRYEEYEQETDASFWNDDADEVIEGDEDYLKYARDLD